MKKKKVLFVVYCGTLLLSVLLFKERTWASSVDLQNSTELITEETIMDSPLNKNVNNYVESKASGISGPGLKSIPYGAKKLDGVFDNANTAGSGSGKNVVVPQYPTNGTNDNRPYDEIRLSGSQNWLSVFSNDYQKLDFSKDFNGRVFVQFQKRSTDGLAFVLHNDVQKSKAITSAVSSLDGQNLGVYGSYRGVGETAFRNPAEKAIQNSLAIEFDMYGNWNTDSDNFDRNLFLATIYPTHMAYSFPGNPDSYAPFGAYSWTNNGNPSIATQKHYIGNQAEGYQSLTNVVDDTWYEFRFSYQIGVGLSYFLFNPMNNSQTDAVLIPDKQLETNLKLSENNHTAYWGFTSSNGNLSGTTKFAFAETPVDSVASLANQVTNKDGMEITVPRDEPLSNKFISSGDPVEFQSLYTLASSQRSYTIDSWKGKIDRNVIAIPSDNQISVSYSVNDGEEKTQNVIVDANGNFALEGINLTIPREGGHVEFKLSLPTITDLSAQKTVFYSNINGRYGTDNFNTIVESESSYFWINKHNSNPVIDSVVFNEASFKDYLSTFGFKMDYHDDDMTDELKMKIVINKQFVDEISLADVSAQDFSWTLPVPIDLLSKDNILKRGRNVLELTLTDKDGATTTQESEFQVEGYQGFEKVTTEYQWNYSRAQLPVNREPQARQEEMIFKARDTTSTTPTSKVSLSVTSITSDENSLPASDFVFKENNQVYELGAITFEPNQEYVFDQTEGLLLKLSDQDNPGEYRGVINWTIKDAP
ncbi:hypothetical protein [Enterococcus sp. HY326]|uniref:hypothetical protein n=1 Tax=Enterococcus sp. HY326 TaxID=2971265 RepID=UPI00223EF6A4|nr:hypothetical protein [Enterococcus sp. HY326]